jgi:hypothetical protein
MVASAVPAMASGFSEAVTLNQKTYYIKESVALNTADKETAHNWVATKYVDATCIANAYAEVKCVNQNCGKTAIAILGETPNGAHKFGTVVYEKSWGEGSVDSPKFTVKSAKCSICGQLAVDLDNDSSEYANYFGTYWYVTSSGVGTFSADLTDTTKYEVVTKNANCTQNGEIAYYKLTNGKREDTATYTITLEATGEHTYGEWKTTVEPTLSTNGTKVRTCSVCGKEDKGVVPMTCQHTNKVLLSEGKDATCTSAGYKLYRCLTCNNEGTTDTTSTNYIAELHEVLPKLDHTYITNVYGESVCKNCGILKTVADTQVAETPNDTATSATAGNIVGGGIAAAGILTLITLIVKYLGSILF